MAKITRKKPLTLDQWMTFAGLSNADLARSIDGKPSSISRYRKRLTAVPEHKRTVIVQMSGGLVAYELMSRLLPGETEAPVNPSLADVLEVSSSAIEEDKEGKSTRISILIPNNLNDRAMNASKCYSSITKSDLIREGLRKSVEALEAIEVSIPRQGREPFMKKAGDPFPSPEELLQ